MQEKCKSVLKMFRERAGFTQEKAAEQLNISVHSLSNYETFTLETGKNAPPEDIVLAMADLYEIPFLPIFHLKENTRIGQLFFSEVELLDLPLAFLKLQAELEDIRPLEDPMRKVVLNNRIDDNEVEISDIFIKELMEGIISSWSLIFSAIEKRPLREQRSQSLNLAK